MKKLFLFIFLILLLSLVSAHNPRIVFDRNINLDNLINVENPEISKAYYGELKGSANYYLIERDSSFNFYFNLLVPDLKDSRTDFVIELFGEKEFIVFNGSEFAWTKYFEGVARDNYLKGPEFDKRVLAGKYYIKISNPENQGKYALAIGKVESFPLIEIINVYFTLPRIKSYFFEKPWITAFFNVFGLGLLIVIAIFVLIVWALFRLMKNKDKVRKKKK